MTASIFMVAMNDYTPGNETILGFYPTRALAEHRKAVIETDPDWQSEEADVAVFVHEINAVGAEGVDTQITLR